MLFNMIDEGSCTFVKCIDCSKCERFQHNVLCMLQLILSLAKNQLIVQINMVLYLTFISLRPFVFEIVWIHIYAIIIQCTLNNLHHTCIKEQLLPLISHDGHTQNHLPKEDHHLVTICVSVVCVYNKCVKVLHNQRNKPEKIEHENADFVLLSFFLSFFLSSCAHISRKLQTTYERFMY